ncbi:hypothetical protein GCM10010210_45640 [Pseudonocardia hydrocarbonoxydans]|uniref:XdhC- CoxI domain-containing protein n=1 Tax=Pseudonocardia hydrocarbonoxydans TaxID=76726 RepID=A0A4Y3WWD8_9PSEU|nr:hypothetical protein PHY01_48840 [Pseudonocardia hydrocarbonoxydans]
MRDVVDQLAGWWKSSETAALATVVGTYSSAPRQPGASMLIGPDGEAVGSVSGGCVEGAVYELGQGGCRAFDEGEHLHLEFVPGRPAFR